MRRIAGVASIGRLKPTRPAAIVALVAAALALIVRSAFVHSSAAVGDYRIDAKPAVDALSRLDLGGFVHHVTLMGTFSLFLRAPVVALVRAFGGSDLSTYTWGALVCALPLAGLAVWLLVDMGRRDKQPSARLAIAALFALTPFIGAAITWGHPEELLTTTLCIVAVIAASRDRTLIAAVALGLAIATKQWALVAIGPVLVAAPARRLRLSLVSGTIVVLFMMPIALADTQSFALGAKSLANAHSWVSVVSVWWPFSNFHTHLVTDGVGNVAVTTFKLPASLNVLPHGLIVAIGLPLGAVLLARRRRPTLDQLLSFLALLLLLRCVLDPWNNLYYQVGFMIALLTRDALCARGLPIASAFATVLGWATFWHLAAPNRGVPTYAFYMMWTIALGIWLVAQTYSLRLPTLLSAELPATRRRATQAA